MGDEMQQTRSQLAVAWLKLLLLKGQAAEHAQDALLLRQPTHSAAMHAGGRAPTLGPLEAVGRAMSPTKR